MAFLPFTHTHVANGVHNPLEGWQYEYLPFPALVEIAYVSTDVNVVATITSGSDTLVEDSPVPGGGTIGIPPAADLPMLQDIAAAGDRLKVRFRETAGGTPSIAGWIRLTQLG